MEKLADGVFLLSGFPRYTINQYLIGDVLVDAGTRWSAGRLIRELRNSKLTAHVLTHVHPDHQGASRAVCEAFSIPCWCGEGDIEAAANAALMLQRMPHRITRMLSRLIAGPAHPADTALRAGDRLGEFKVVETPGHTAGHISLWRQHDRVLILGDLLAGFHPVTRRSGLCEPPRIFSADPAQNRRSLQSVAELEPSLVCFGHGPPLRDTRQFVSFVRGLG